MPDSGEKPAKRMGRPPKAPEKGKRQNYTFRMSSSDRDVIATAAEESGRSLSEEIEQRLIRLAQIENEFGTGSRLDMLRLIAVTLRFTERLISSSDYEDRQSLVEFKSAINTTIDQFLKIKSLSSRREKLVDALAYAGTKGQAAALALSSSLPGLIERDTDLERDLRSKSLELVGMTLLQQQAEREGIPFEDFLKKSFAKPAEDK